MLIISLVFVLVPLVFATTVGPTGDCCQPYWTNCAHVWVKDSTMCEGKILGHDASDCFRWVIPIYDFERLKCCPANCKCTDKDSPCYEPKWST